MPMDTVKFTSMENSIALLTTWLRRQEKALQRAKKIYESMCGEYEDEMVRYSDKDYYEDESDGALYVEEDAENGYYEISFGYEEHHEYHSVAVEEWELKE